jgi:cytochrome c peroxidase
MSIPARALAGAVLLAVLGVRFAVPARTQSIIGSLPFDAVAPPDNPTTPEKIALGRLLFWDPVLSGGRDVACATCHHPDFGYSDGLDLSIGAHGLGLGATRRFDTPGRRPFTRRNSPTLLNIGFAGVDMSFTYDPAAAPMFWDARVRSLETQALEPIKALEEMRGATVEGPVALDTVISRLQAIPDYQTRFARAFATRPAVTRENLARAIAAFERSLLAVNAPFDRYVRGDETALTPLQVSGMLRFQSIGCANCHKGPMFTDYQVHTLGVADHPGLAEPDTGVDGRYRFRTPTLRNLVYTAPYMHNGALTTLDDVLSFYNGVRGSRLATHNPNVRPDDLDPFLFNLFLGGFDRRDLVAFLESLSDESFDRTVPEAVPSGLPVGGRIGE